MIRHVHGYIAYPGLQPPVDLDPWTNLDGRVGALLGLGSIAGLTPQHSTILNSYGGLGSRQRTVNGSFAIAPPTGTRFQPPWKVAGVDYYVGGPTSGFAGVALLNSTTFTAAFIADVTAKGGDTTTFPIAHFGTSSTPTYDNWDLRGVRFVIDGTAPPFSFTNCQMGGGSSRWWVTTVGAAINLITQGGSSAGGLVRYCTLDCGQTYVNNVTNVAQHVSGGVAVATPLTIEYNWFIGSPAEFINVSLFDQSFTTVRYNFFDNSFAGYGWFTSVSSATNQGGFARITISPTKNFSNGETLIFDNDVRGTAATITGVVSANTVFDTSLPWPGSTFTDRLGYGGGTAGGATNTHMNYIQENFTATSANVTMKLNWNCTYQTTAFGAEGWQLDPTTTVPKANLAAECTNNTMISLLDGGTGSMSAMIHGSTHTNSIEAGDPVLMNGLVGANFMDSTGATLGAGKYYPNYDWTSWTRTNNIDMTDGSTSIPT